MPSKKPDTTKSNANPNRMNFSEMEERILAFWDSNKIFEKVLGKDSPNGNFVFFEGPPGANGVPGIHHMITRAFKDAIPRYKTMRGFHVERKAGWDTHGLPVEIQVQKELGIEDKKEIETLRPTKHDSIAHFNSECKRAVMRYQAEWERATRRIAFWLDLEHPYLTYANDYIESLWWIFKQAWDKGLVTQDYKVMHYCASCGTALSSHEVAQGYETVTEDSVYVKMAVSGEKNTYFVVWTTTPWTLVGNVALAVGEDIEYVKIRISKADGENEFLILAKERLSILDAEYEVVESMKGKDLLGVEYAPLYDFFTDSEKKGWYVISGDFVTTSDGSGIVHMAWYGEDDYNMIKKFDLPWAQHINAEGRVIADIERWAGVWFKDLDPEVSVDLNQRGLLLKTESYEHIYPFCWRCATPLLYHATTSWFIKMSLLRDRLIANNDRINWIPDNIKKGRFGEWIEGVKDWAIARERYWGTPLPIWCCTACDHKICVGSYEELERLAGRMPLDREGNVDIHRPYVDELTIACEKCSDEMKRVPEVADVWFDAGSMPFAQWHYPFENKERVDDGVSYPADYIAEAIDQTRGWFYTLLAVSTFLGRGEPFRNVISIGHIRDKHGKKMSKSLGNVVKPSEVIDRYGADSLRWHFYTISAPGDYKNFDMNNVDQVFKKVFLILWNVYTFYETFSDELLLSDATSEHVMDRWVMARFHALNKEVTAGLDGYDLFGTARKIQDFINELSTWYVRRSRARFKSSDAREKQNALNTLRTVLLGLSKILAPYVPFFSEELYQRLKAPNDLNESVHLCDWPDIGDVDSALLARMQTVRDLVSIALEKRATAKIPIRQVLSELSVGAQDDITAFENILREEVNVQRVVFQKGALGAEIDTQITPELAKLGMVRELTRHINALRKQAGLTVKDRVGVSYETDSATLQQVIGEFGAELNAATLTTSFTSGRLDVPEDHVCEVVVAGETLRLYVQ
ncbi:MAG TPA: isoleucine--tRNA ligase [Patescibacteria group bacterium]|nr:isoleucine--tRNA ligase [Patescibacteria group bacterium]